MEIAKRNSLVAGYLLLCVAALFVLFSKSFETSLILAVAISCVLIFIFVIDSGIYNILFAFILYLPFQDILVVSLSLTGLFPRNFLRAMMGGKEILLFVLVVYLLLRQRLFRPRSFEIFLMLFLGWTLLYAVLPDGILFEGSSPQARLMGLRNTLVPVLLYFVGRHILYDREKYLKAFRLLFIVSFIVSVVGIVEMSFMSRSTVFGRCLVELESLKRSADNQEGHIDHLMRKDEHAMRTILNVRVPRLTSFYLKPLQAAYSLMVVIAFATVFLVSQNYHLIGFNRRYFYIFYFVFWAALILTITRAAIAVTLIGVITVCVLRNKAKYAVIISLILALFCMPMISYVFDYLHTSYNFADPSSENHLKEYSRGIKVLTEQFWGVGLGQGGSVGGAYGQLKAGGENLYLAIGGERGVCGLSLFIAFVMLLLIRLYRFARNDKLESLERNIVIAVFSLTVGFAITSLTTGTWFGFKDAFIYWWLLGLCGQLMFDSRYLSVPGRAAV